MPDGFSGPTPAAGPATREARTPTHYVTSGEGTDFQVAAAPLALPSAGTALRVGPRRRAGRRVRACGVASNGPINVPGTLRPPVTRRAG